MASSSSSIKVAMDTMIYISYCEMIWNEMKKCDKNKTHEMKEKKLQRRWQWVLQIKAPIVLDS